MLKELYSSKGTSLSIPSEKYLLSSLPAELRTQDIFKACALSLGLTFFITYFPARRAARMRPVEALRYD